MKAFIFCLFAVSVLFPFLSSQAHMEEGGLRDQIYACSIAVVGRIEESGEAQAPGENVLRVEEVVLVKPGAPEVEAGQILTFRHHQGEAAEGEPAYTVYRKGLKGLWLFGVEEGKLHKLGSNMPDSPWKKVHVLRYYESQVK